MNRLYGLVSPATCSAKVTAGQTALPHRKRRTFDKISDLHATGRGIPQLARVAAMQPPRQLAAAVASRVAARTQAPITTRPVLPVDILHAQSRQMRQQLLNDSAPGA